MIWVFPIIVVLLGMLLIPNALYAFRTFLADRNLVWLISYMVFLFLLGYFLYLLTTHTVDTILKAREIMAQPDF
jgi:hypothetical protein